MLVSGVVAMLALLSAVFIWGVSATRSADTARHGRIDAAVTAESAFAYAAVRLAAEGGDYPLSVRKMPSPENRGDDWTSRDALDVKFTDTANVSWSHGEPWTDADGDGAFDPWETYTDANGDGRFTARTGRLRGAPGKAGVSFALRIHSTGSLFPVNASHVGVSRLGDNLGAILFADGEVPERVDRAYGPGEPIRISALGRHLLTEDLNDNGALDPGEDRDGDGVLESVVPPGGYRDMDQVRAVLAGWGYGSDRIEKVVPYIDLGPCESAAIEMTTAPREILEALFSYVAWNSSSDLWNLQGAIPSGQGLFQPYGGATGHPWTGGAFRSGGILDYAAGFDGAAMMIYPDEARTIADWLLEFRRTSGRGSWLALRRALCERARPDTVHPAGSLFAADVAPLLPWPEIAYGWARAKADAAFFSVFPDYSGRSGWGIDPGPGAPFIARRFLGIGTPDPMELPYPAASGAWPSSPYDPSTSGGNPYPLTLAPPTTFTVEASSRAGAARGGGRGTFRAAELFEIMNDLDNIPDWRHRGISKVDLGNSNQRRRAVADTVADLVDPSGPGTVAIPAPFRGVVDGNVFNPHGFGIPPVDMNGIVGAGSSLALAGKYTGHQGAYLYWPFQPDDVGHGNDLASEAELATFTRGASLSPPAPEPPVYPTLFHKKVTPPQAQSIGSNSMGVWDYDVRISREEWCWPFDFPPLTSNDTVGGMRSFSIEMWTSAYGSVFTLEGDSVGPPSAADDDIKIAVGRTDASDANGVPGTRYTASFEAPASSIFILKDNDNQLPAPPLPPMFNNGHYKFDLAGFVPDVDLGDLANPLDDRIATGHDHILFTVENLEVDEDTNGNGQVDDWEDWNNDNDVAGDRRNELTVTLYVNGRFVAAARDSDGIKESARNRPEWFFRGRLFPSYPYPMSQDLLNGRMKKLVFNGDEVKFHDIVRRASGVLDADSDGETDLVLKEQDADDRWRLGRFYLPPGPFGHANNPEYLSPMFTFGSPVTVKHAGWLGLPASDPCGAERVGMVVKVGLPRANPLRVDGPPLFPVLRRAEETTGPADFASLGPISALGYSVEFENLKPTHVISDDAPLYATPFFEGVWIVIQGNNRSPAWLERD